MIDSAYKLIRQGSTYPRPTRQEWLGIVRRCKRVDTGWRSPCLIWLGAIDEDGHGQVKWRGNRRKVHRIAYAWHNEHTPARRDVEHLCKQRACCNPHHLTALPRRVNRSNQRGANTAPPQFNKTTIEEYAVHTDSLPF